MTEVSAGYGWEKNCRVQVPYVTMFLFVASDNTLGKQGKGGYDL